MRIVSALVGTQFGCWGLNCYHFSGNPLHIGSSVRLDACEHDQTVCMYQQITSYVGRVQTVASKCEKADICMWHWRTQFPTDDELTALFGSAEAGQANKYSSLRQKGLETGINGAPFKTQCDPDAGWGVPQVCTQCCTSDWCTGNYYMTPLSTTAEWKDTSTHPVQPYS